jgi:hypothetical protein
MNRRKKGMPMKNRMISTLLLAVIPIGVASAEVISTRTRILPNFFSDSSPHLIPLNNAGSTVLPFVTTTDNQRIVISFNAECSVGVTNANNFSTFVNLDILVDGVAASPSSDDNAFCSAHNSQGGRNAGFNPHCAWHVLKRRWRSAIGQIAHPVWTAGLGSNGSVRRFDRVL